MCCLSQGTLPGGRKQSLKPRRQDSRLEEKKSQALGIRDPLPKAARTARRALPLDSLVQRDATPHFMCGVSFNAHIIFTILTLFSPFCRKRRLHETTEVLSLWSAEPGADPRSDLR